MISCDTHDYYTLEEDSCPWCAVEDLILVCQEQRETKHSLLHYTKHKRGCNALLGVVRGLDGKPFVPRCSCGLKVVLSD